MSVLKNANFNKIAFVGLALVIGVGVVGAAQVSSAIRSGELESKSGGLRRMLAAWLEPDPAEDEAATAISPAGPEARPAVLTRILQGEAAPDAVPDACAEPPPVAAGVVMGDRLRLRFFEKTAFGAAVGGDARDRDVAEIAYERLDLSGGYEVGADGAISLPLAGRVAVAHMTLGCIEAVLAGRINESSRAAAQVVASFEHRPPVTVRGAVRTPGGYDHEPGMSVERLLALAGSPAAGGIQDAQHYIGLQARKDELERARLGLVLKTARAEAMRRRSPTLGLAEADRAAIVDALGANRLASEQAALAAEVEAAAVRRSGLRTHLRELDNLEREIGEMVVKVEGQYKELSERQEELLALKRRGLAPTNRLDSNSFNMIAAERGMVDLQKSRLQTRSERNAAMQRIEVEESERRRRLAIELRDLSEAVAELAGKRAMLGAELSMFEAGLTPSGAGLRLSVKIERRAVGAVEHFEAEPDTLLLPGDLVVVTAALPEAGPIMPPSVGGAPRTRAQPEPAGQAPR